MHIIYKFITILFFFIYNVNSARILCFYTVPYHSHEVVFEAFTEHLSNQGHQIVVVAPIPDKKLPNVTMIDVKNLSYSLWEELSSKNPIISDTIAIDSLTFVDWIYSMMYPIVEAQLNVPEVQNLIKNETENFDLVIIEGCIRPALVISARFKAPVIVISSYYGIADNYYSVGAITDAIVFPDYYVLQTWSSSLWNKLTSVYVSAKLRLKEWKIENIENAMIKKYFGQKAPTMADLRKKVQMLLLNVHHVWDYNRPVPPNVLYMGTLNLKSPKPLHKDLKKYLDESKNGVIYMSLGSKIRSSDLPPETITTILKVFRALPYDVVWKWDAESLPNKPANVRLEKWLPQSDMLFHPKVKAFITHAGLQSTDEAIAARVPLIGLPIRCDQHTNAANYEHFGIGISLNIDRLNEEEFKNAIMTVSEIRSYRENIDKLSRLMQVERVGALDKALKFINHIATYGGHQLRPPLPDLSFVEYYMLDVIGAMGLIATTTIGLLIFITKQLYHYLHKLFDSNKLKSH